MKRLRMAVTVGLLLTVTGCATPSDEAGMGLPTLTAEQAATALADATGGVADHVGALAVVDNGCFVWSAPGSAADGAWIVWPDGDRQDADAVVLDGGTRVTADDGLRGVGGIVTLDALPGGDDANSYFGSFGRFCEAETRDVLVLTEVTSTGAGS